MPLLPLVNLCAALFASLAMIDRPALCGVSPLSPQVSQGCCLLHPLLDVSGLPLPRTVSEKTV